MGRLIVVAVAVLLTALSGTLGAAAAWPEASDLNPVTVRSPGVHPPVVLVRDGLPVAAILIDDPAEYARAPLKAMVALLQTCLKEATGTTLPLILPVEGVVAPLPEVVLVIGSGPVARAAGLDGARLPVEGFGICTSTNSVFIYGHDALMAPESNIRSHGTAWGVTEFLERYLGVRWYYPSELGRCVPANATVVMAPSWIEDAPVFRKRDMWRIDMPFLRSGQSWPSRLRVHSTSWGSGREYRAALPEVFERLPDGKRNFSMPCYGSPETLRLALEAVASYKAGAHSRLGIKDNIISISPPDAWLRCTCDNCLALWEPGAGEFGVASRVVAQFVARFAWAVQERWPDMRVLYLPYANYTTAPKGIVFPGNLEVQLCGMAGLAYCKEPRVREAEQRNIDAWVALSGKPIQNWHYSCWPAHRTLAPYAFPYTIQRHYRDNRTKTVGSFINGPDHEGQLHWPRFHLSLYVWLKVLWDPEFPVEAAIDAYCERLYGAAAGTVRELVKLQIDGWEHSAWPDGRLTPAAIHEVSYPPAVVEQMRILLAQAQREAAGDARTLARLGYLAAPFEPFFRESEAYHAQARGLTDERP